MARTWQLRETKAGAALAAAAVECGLAVAIIWGLAGRLATPSGPVADLVTITPALPPKAEPAKPAKSGSAAPENRKAKPVPMAAPSPRLAVASPSPAATSAGKGSQTAAGAAHPGPGSGAGGEGEGAGSGEGGAGSGSGLASAPLRIAGALRDRDYPRGSAATGTVAISFRVRTDGRVDSCRVVGSSGAAELDMLTCELVEARFRYRPAFDTAGRPVDTMLRTSFTWGMRQRG